MKQVYLERGDTLLEAVDIGGKKYDKTKMVVAAGVVARMLDLS